MRAQKPRMHVGAASIVALVFLLTACEGGDAGPDGPGTPRDGTRDLATIEDSLPDGFTVSVAAENLPYGTSLSVDESGGAYMGVLEKGGDGALYRLHDRDGDGVMEEVARLAGLPGLLGGVLVRPEGLYLSLPGKIALGRDEGGGLRTLRTVVNGLPLSAIKIHSTNGAVFGLDGRLYFGVGASCNACTEPDPRSATVMTCDLEGDCRVFANGLRNVWDLAVDPRDGRLWGGDNGPDPIGGATLQAQDEVQSIRADQHHGYPFCWGRDRGLDCEGTVRPEVEIEAGDAPAGLAFATSDAMPAEYRGDLFVALWGGRRVIRVDTLAGEATDFAVFDRPVDVVEDRDGTLLVLDADAARIYRISPS